MVKTQDFTNLSYLSEINCGSLWLITVSGISWHANMHLVWLITVSLNVFGNKEVSKYFEENIIYNNKLLIEDWK